MLIHPQFDPVAIAIGPLAVRWYGLMYLIAFLAFMFLGRYRARQNVLNGWLPRDVDDLLFFGVIGVIVGGRLGEVLFFQPGYYFSHPLEIPAVWKGGMSFHGGFLGVLAAVWYYARKSDRAWLDVTDFIAPLIPLGLAAGRIGNFINGELWGRPADPGLPWAMIFPQVDNLPRHPSQLYQAGLEGLALFVLLWWFSSKPRARGEVSALFLIGYGTFRFIAEFAREPDDFLGYLALHLSMGQWLSLPMIVAGGWLFARSRRRG